MPLRARGCLEAYLGDYALSREAATALDRDGSNPNDQDALLELLFERAKAGHGAAEVIFNEQQGIWRSVCPMLCSCLIRH